LGRESTRPDKEAYLKLFPLANKKLLYEITHPKLSKDYFLAVNTALEQTKIYDRIVITNLGSILFPEIVAEMADFLLRLEETETVLSMGQYAGEVIFSIRTLRHDLNMGEVVKRLVSGRGTAGGHGMMAGGKVDDVPAEPRAVAEIEQLLTARLLAEYGLTGQQPARLV
jgi:nanoRNase/pAp phosphatase (c-di-AMP/oligoRNAs hydrolase)